MMVSGRLYVMRIRGDFFWLIKPSWRCLLYFLSFVENLTDLMIMFEIFLKEIEDSFSIHIFKLHGKLFIYHDEFLYCNMSSSSHKKYNKTEEQKFYETEKVSFFLWIPLFSFLHIKYRELILAKFKPRTTFIYCN